MSSDRDLPPDRRKRHTFRFTDPEWEIVSEAARAVGQIPTNFVVTAALENAKKIIEPIHQRRNGR